MSDYYLTPNEQVQPYHGKNKVHFDDDDDVHFVLDQHAELDFYSASSLKQQSAGKTCRSARTHYSDSETSSLYSYSLVLRAQQRTN